MDIFTVTKKMRGWSDAVQVESINSDSTDSYPSMTADGTLYFASNRSGGRGDYDLYRSRLVNGRNTGGYGEGDLYVSYNRGGSWSAPEILPTSVNSREYEYTPLVSPDGKYLFFSRGWGEIFQIDLAAAGVSPPKS